MPRCPRECRVSDLRLELLVSDLRSEFFGAGGVLVTVTNPYRAPLEGLWLRRHEAIAERQALTEEIAELDRALGITSARRGWLGVGVALAVGVTAWWAVRAVEASIHRLPKTEVARRDSRTVREAAERHLADRGSCPSVEDLVRERELLAARADDPWGNPYEVLCAGAEVLVLSRGADQRPGTSDDVVAR